ncbi:MAG: aldehyde dehydrogenase family protein, partial [Gammaproteobacteria bacterium]|nr:aldehyde dehydrogenase family protein [Gammaproteobacteria bacterium]
MKTGEISMKAAETDAQDLQRDTSTIEEMNTVFSNQSKAFWRDGAPAYDDRIANIDRLQQIMLENKDRIVDAIQADFGDRSSHEIVLAEIVSTLGSLKNTKKNLKKWMRPQKRRVDMMFQPGKAKIIYQPKGVAGIIAPWNYPFYLTATPLIGALAAGNRVMIKPSEATPETSALIKEIFGKAFDSELVHVTVGGTAVGAAFSKLSWDHLLFTGSTALGKIIMQAAAENLTPVTLELGGKSPLIIHPEYPVDAVVKRIIAGKCFNGGQTCVAPDYLLVAADRVAPLIGELETQLGKNYPTIYN